MATKIKLVDFHGESIWHGNIFRVPGKCPYERFVDFMVFDNQSEDRPYGLIVTSGYKAGLILVYLPRECSSVEGGVSKKWVMSNWSKWIYPDCGVLDVYFVDRYEVPSEL
ncbi:Imm45 family immunity protein [Pseudomonas sp. GZD-209]|uniref:Imm45 family immunity protein n=1 Tax=Pseudomonas sp. GZD-209 TaxID=3404807 RepID=UPI003BB5CE71